MRSKPPTSGASPAGKFLALWLAAVAVSTIRYVVFVASLVGGPIVGRPIALTPRWLLFVLILAPGVAALAVGARVQVSARVRGFQEAYQLGGLVVLPLVVLLLGQLTGVLYLDVAAVVVIAGAVWLALLLGHHLNAVTRMETTLGRRRPRWPSRGSQAWPYGSAAMSLLVVRLGPRLVWAAGRFGRAAVILR